MMGIPACASDCGDEFMNFLTRARLTGYARVLVALYAVFWTGWFVTGAGLFGLHDDPAGSDFLAIYAGSRLAAGADPGAAYDFARLTAAARGILGVDTTPGPWLYPPIFAAIVAPFTALPYLAAVPAWLLATGAAYLAAVRRTYPGDRLAPWIAAASLPAFFNAMYGQNGFLSAALLGFGLLGLRSAPVLGGAVLGFLVYKPQLAGLVPVVLLIGGQWRALLGFAGGAVAMVGLSLVVVGWDGWLAFAGSVPRTTAMLGAGGENWFKMPTAFVAARLLGLEVPAARIVQILVSAATVTAVAWVWRRPAPFDLKAAALGVGGLLLFPFAFYYDWTVLAVPVAWLVRDMASRGVVSWQLWTVVVAFFFPLFGPTIAALTNLQLGPVVVLVLLAAVIDRAWRASRDHGEAQPPS